MHIFFSGIGGAGIGPLAQVALEAGYDVSGSDKQDTQYIHYLREHGISDIHIGQDFTSITELHARKPIDWFVYTSALPMENPDAPELQFCQQQNIRTSKRDELLNQIVQEKGLKMIAVAGTHGKTTTTAMLTWLFTQLDIPVSYILPAKTSYAELGHFDGSSEYFVYECDEYDRNFLAFEPHLSLITGVSWDHHEIFHTRDDYQQAFRDFIKQSQLTYIWRNDAEYLSLEGTPVVQILNPSDAKSIGLKGEFNRTDALLACQALAQVTDKELGDITARIPAFPGLQRRMEQIAPNLYSDYAHTPEKIRGAMSVAGEMAADSEQKLVVIYEPLTNRRQHYMLNDYKDCFAGAEHVYWVPSYLAREDPEQRIIPPAELISHLADPSIAEPAGLNDDLKSKIQSHLDGGDMVVAMAGGGGGSLDDWLRQNFQ
jgi:UDP-N-acetylmuramate--alanine ligase